MSKVLFLSSIFAPYAQELAKLLPDYTLQLDGASTVLPSICKDGNWVAPRGAEGRRIRRAITKLEKSIGGPLDPRTLAVCIGLGEARAGGNGEFVFETDAAREMIDARYGKTGPQMKLRMMHRFDTLIITMRQISRLSFSVQAVVNEWDEKTIETLAAHLRSQEDTSDHPYPYPTVIEAQAKRILFDTPSVVVEVWQDEKDEWNARLRLPNMRPSSSLRAKALLLGWRLEP